jgi:hypothetical protein
MGIAGGKKPTLFVCMTGGSDCLASDIEGVSPGITGSARRDATRHPSDVLRLHNRLPSDVCETMLIRQKAMRKEARAPVFSANAQQMGGKRFPR